MAITVKQRIHVESQSKHNGNASNLQEFAIPRLKSKKKLKNDVFLFLFSSRSCITKEHDCANVEYAQIRDLVSCPLFSLLRADILCSWRSSLPHRSKPTQLATLAVRCCRTGIQAVLCSAIQAKRR